jgi:hypothetical protein
MRRGRATSSQSAEHPNNRKDDANNDQSNLRLITALRKRGIALTLHRTGTLEIGNFKALTASEKRVIDVHLDEIIAYLKAHPPLVPQSRALQPIASEPSASSQVHHHAAEVSRLRSMTLRTSPQSAIALRATLFGVVRERRRALG